MFLCDIWAEISEWLCALQVEIPQRSATHSAKEAKTQQAIETRQGGWAYRSLLGRTGLVESCSPSLTGSRGADRGCEGGVKRGRIEGKVMRRPGECLEEPTLAMPAPHNQLSCMCPQMTMVTKQLGYCPSTLQHPANIVSTYRQAA